MCISLSAEISRRAPVNWASVNGETNRRHDDADGRRTRHGGILLQRETEIGASENAIELMERLSYTGADLLSETLAMFDELSRAAAGRRAGDFCADYEKRRRRD
jgi:methionyl-tRNA formyltransferase